MARDTRSAHQQYLDATRESKHVCAPMLQVYNWATRSSTAHTAPDETVYARVLAQHDEVICDPRWLVLAPIDVECEWEIIQSFIDGEDTGCPVYRGVIDWFGMPYSYAIITAS